LKELTEGNQTEDLYAETAYLNTVEGTDKNLWEIRIGIEDKQVSFKVDTGTEVTALSDSTWKSLNFFANQKYHFVVRIIHTQRSWE